MNLLHYLYEMQVMTRYVMTRYVVASIFKFGLQVV